VMNAKSSFPERANMKLRGIKISIHQRNISLANVFSLIALANWLPI
jgi:hypothetical protein